MLGLPDPPSSAIVNICLTKLVKIVVLRNKCVNQNYTFLASQYALADFTDVTLVSTYGEDKADEEDEE